MWRGAFLKSSFLGWNLSLLIGPIKRVLNSPYSYYSGCSLLLTGRRLVEAWHNFGKLVRRLDRETMRAGLTNTARPDHLRNRKRKIKYSSVNISSVNWACPSYPSINYQSPIFNHFVSFINPLPIVIIFQSRSYRYN